MKRRTAPRSKAGMDAAIVEVRGKRPLTKQRIRHEVIPLLEFAWASGLLLWTAEEYAAALLTLFPKEYASDPIIELSKHAFQMDERRKFIMQSGGQAETPGVKRAKAAKTRTDDDKPVKTAHTKGRRGPRPNSYDGGGRY